eukprot:TRINITY_DN3474_c0_g1_i1.p1 TRINITY_DN3474_c0_g1~~TRINITY_DN3474_c0_g1_i1.p1  ORF type:complete len:850 (-),score=108.84 TRINITY_DN3474_c0_g1_i1:19-2568(-)
MAAAVEVAPVFAHGTVHLRAWRRSKRKIHHLAHRRPNLEPHCSCPRPHTHNHSRSCSPRRSSRSPSPQLRSPRGYHERYQFEEPRASPRRSKKKRSKKKKKHKRKPSDKAATHQLLQPLFPTNIIAKRPVSEPEQPSALPRKATSTPQSLPSLGSKNSQLPTADGRTVGSKDSLRGSLGQRTQSRSPPKAGMIRRKSTKRPEPLHNDELEGEPQLEQFTPERVETPAKPGEPHFLRQISQRFASLPLLRPDSRREFLKRHASLFAVGDVVSHLPPAPLRAPSMVLPRDYSTSRTFIPPSPSTDSEDGESLTGNEENDRGCWKADSELRPDEINMQVSETPEARQTDLLARGYDVSITLEEGDHDTILLDLESEQARPGEQHPNRRSSSTNDEKASVNGGKRLSFNHLANETLDVPAVAFPLHPASPLVREATQRRSRSLAFTSSAAGDIAEIEEVYETASTKQFLAELKTASLAAALLASAVAVAAAATMTEVEHLVEVRAAEVSRQLRAHKQEKRNRLQRMERRRCLEEDLLSRRWQRHQFKLYREAVEQARLHAEDSESKVREEWESRVHQWQEEHREELLQIQQEVLDEENEERDLMEQLQRKQRTAMRRHEQEVRERLEDMLRDRAERSAKEAEDKSLEARVTQQLAQNQALGARLLQQQMDEDTDDEDEIPSPIARRRIMSSIYETDDMGDHSSSSEDEFVGQGYLDTSIMDERHDAAHRRTEIIMLRAAMSPRTRQKYPPNLYYRLTVTNARGWNVGYKIRYRTQLYKVMQNFLAKIGEPYTPYLFAIRRDEKYVVLDPAKTGIHYRLQDQDVIEAVELPEEARLRRKSRAPKRNKMDQSFSF